MLARLSLALVISIALVAPQAIEASPITYDFTGTLNQPINGSSQFSGSFTIDSSNPNGGGGVITPGGSGTVIGENGDQVSMTVHLGGQRIDFVNTPQGPNSARFEAIGGVAIEVPLPPMAAPTVVFSVAGRALTSDQIEFTLNFTRPGTAPELADLTSFASSSYPSSVSVTGNWGGQSQATEGTLTSIEQVSAPEPTALVVFGAMALGAMALRRMSRG